MRQNILVITPLDKEYAGLLDNLTTIGLEARPGKIGKLDIHRIPNLNITLARGGHGKVQFGVQTQYLLDQAQFDLVVCAGAAGTLAPTVKVGDLVVATETVEHDYHTKFMVQPKPRFAGDQTAILQLKALKSLDTDYKVHFGIMASGDEDVIDIQRGVELRQVTDALAVAWEGVGGARACAFSEVPYLEMRGATDTADHAAPAVFYVNLKIVMKNIAHLLAQWLTEQQ